MSTERFAVIIEEAKSNTTVKYENLIWDRKTNLKNRDCKNNTTDRKMRGVPRVRYGKDSKAARKKCEQVSCYMICTVHEYKVIPHHTKTSQKMMN